MKYLCTFLLSLLSIGLNAQVLDSSGYFSIQPDSIISNKKKIPDAEDTTLHKKKVIIPRKSTIRSAILPGWGQAYNGKAWKIPIVYAALGTTAYIFVDNISFYRDLRYAYRVLSDTDPSNDGSIKEELKVYQPSSIKHQRDQFRQYIDYSVLFFVFFWGLNVVDATVDGHLKAFDVSKDLSLQLKGGYSPMANTSGLSLVLNIGRPENKQRSLKYME